MNTPCRMSRSPHRIDVYKRQVMADAVSECRTAADQAAELNETGQMGLLRLAEVWSTIRAKEGMRCV